MKTAFRLSGSSTSCSRSSADCRVRVLPSNVMRLSFSTKQTTSAARFLGMLFMLPLGLVEKLPFIRSVSGRDIRVEVIAGPDVDPIQADGDTVSQMPAEIRVEDVQTRVLVP